MNKLGIKHRLITGTQMRSIINSAEPADIILVRAHKELTTTLENIVEGGVDFTHAILVINKDNIVDATDLGVLLRDILESFVGVSRVTLLS